MKVIQIEDIKELVLIPSEQLVSGVLVNGTDFDSWYDSEGNLNDEYFGEVFGYHACMWVNGRNAIAVSFAVENKIKEAVSKLESIKII